MTVDVFCQKCQCHRSNSSCSLRRSGFKLNPEEWCYHPTSMDQLSIKGSYMIQLAMLRDSTRVRLSQVQSITITGKNFQNIQEPLHRFLQGKPLYISHNTGIVCRVPCQQQVRYLQDRDGRPDGSKIEGPEFKVVPAEKTYAAMHNEAWHSAITLSIAVQLDRHRSIPSHTRQTSSS